MKKFTTIIFMLLISFCFVLTGCGGTNLKMPENHSNVSSNGGFVVGAGNYMYFANAYKSNSDISAKSENDGEGVAQHSIKRVELDTSNQYNTWFKIKKQEEKISYENVLNKIAGYQTANMYVVGDYLYFTSPNVHKNKSNEHDFTLHTLFKIKLDGTGLQEIYTTETNSAKFYLQGSEAKTILIFDGDKIKQVNVSANSTSVDLIASNVENVVFPSNAEQDIAWLYYTSNRAEDSLFSGNILNKVSLQTKEVEQVYAPVNETIKIVAYENGRLFYIKSGIESTKGLYSTNFSSSMPTTPHRTLTDGIENESDILFITADAGRSAFVFIYNNNLYVQLLSANNQSQARKVSTAETTIQFYNGTYVYYSTDAGVYRFSILDAYNAITSSSETISTKQISDQANILADDMDFDGRYVYFFAKGDGQETETKYLYRADTMLEEKNSECIAELLEQDIPEEEEETIEED